MLNPAALAFVCLFVAQASASSTDAYAETWYDGKAEVCGYRWHGSRYGEPRTGEAVAVFVTEPFSKSRHVKADAPDATGGDDVVNVMKLNLVRDFQTGVYDYNTMTSCFLRSDDLRPLKLTFSSAEWCGHVYEELDFRGAALHQVVHSYFDGESGEQALPAPADGLVGEQLFVWLRGLRGAPLRPGESRELPFLSGPFERRLRHVPAAWGRLTVTRAAQDETHAVPAGRFAASVYRLEASDGRRGSVWIEAAAPHRLLAWSWSRDGVELDAAELTGSQRMRYWQEHGEGQEALRAELGLER